LRLDLHVYDANPAARFVFINMRKLREGESLPDGVRVDQITSTGAELSYHGKALHDRRQLNGKWGHCCFPLRKTAMSPFSIYSAASLSISVGVRRWMIHSFIWRAPSDL
jgi:hypothetical protein